MKKYILPIVLLAVATSSECFAVSAAWTGTTDGNWNVNSNWNPATAFPVSANTATFNATVANSTVSMNGTAVNVGTLAFNTNAGSYTFNAGGGNLSAQNIIIYDTVLAPVTETFNVTVNMATNATIRNFSTTAILNLAGGINSNSASAVNLYFNETANPAGTINLGNVTSAGGGAVALNKRSGGVLILSGTNSSTGGAVNLASGEVRLNATGAIWGSGFSITGGIIGLAAEDFTAAITSSGGGGLRWSTPAGDTGFAAYGADRNVNFSGTSTLTWDGFNMIKTGQALILGSTTSTHKLNFQDGLALAGAMRTILVNDGISSTNVDGEISGVITGNATAGIEKTGSGTLSLSNSNTYLGSTIVSAGTLLINGNQTAANGSVSVAAGATLGGNGTIGGATTITGILSPGNSIGTLNVVANTTWQGASSNGTVTDWKFELGALNTADLLNITGNFTKDTSLGMSFRFDFLGSTAIGTFKLVAWSGTTGFSAGDFSYTDLGGGNTGTFQFNGTQLEFVTVPEPGTWELVGFGLFFLVVCSRKAGKCRA